MKTLSVNNNDIHGAGYRFDAGFHLSDGVSIRRSINKSPLGTTTISALSENIFYGLRANRVYVTNPSHAISFMTGANILLTNLDNTKLVSKLYTPCIEEMTLKRGWTLITRSGTVGQTAWSNSTHEGRYGSEDIIRVVPRSSVKGGVVYAYLASRFGHSLLTQGSFGAVIQHIEPSFVGDILIPVFDENLQDDVDKRIQKSAVLREESSKCFHEAVELFERLLCKSKYRSCCHTQVTSSKQISGRFTRFDAQYQIGSNELSKEILGVDTVKVGSVAKKIYVGNRGKRYYVKEGIPFLSSSDMMLFNPVKYSTPISSKAPNLDGLLVHTDDILISRSGTIGNTVIVSDTLNGKAVSEHALRLVIDPDKINPNYVFCYLNTAHGKRVLESLAYGSVIITLGEEFVANIDLPLLSKEAQDTISAKIKQYSSLLDEATRLENEAVSLVEAEIEKWNN